MNHDLKCWVDPFQAVTDGCKRFEIRRSDDREYRVGDTLTLFEYDPVNKLFSGQWARGLVTFLVEASFGLPENQGSASDRGSPAVHGVRYTCMSLADVEAGKVNVGRDGYPVTFRGRDAK